MSVTRELRRAGVSIWLDDLSRERILSGGLARLIAERDVVGITTNPTIFANAFAGTGAYESQLAELHRAGSSPAETAFGLMTADVRSACDVLRPTFDATEGVDGRVSIEVSPAVAHAPAATLAEAHRLRSAVDRENLFVKIPATAAGIAAIRNATAAGISVNVTLIFGLDRYREVVDAYLSGLERAKEAGLQLDTIQSVASFFVSRVDVEVDRRLEALGRADSGLEGRAAIANARLAYEIFEQTLRTPRWQALEAAGANWQRPLWASTGVKSARMRDTVYVEELVAPQTVSTMPEKTLEAVWEHGSISADAITGNLGDARNVFALLEDEGISMADVASTLEAQGIEIFSASWERLLGIVAAA
ncbi:transaldolase [Diaminobutyricibacter tongyongensis]|uniref:Transaldolase n=1 Tax=Leifsonia tongyongensis TaxID=1268043 RepID=A0A6L9XY62_9MICO|nr:transaldolase [Diaminobutyricibacter tongyongensis]NEN05918.1 transaldolase [Diaminobutyricibacter tongyongensis]